MFKEEDYPISKFDTLAIIDYKIAPNDIIEFNIFTNQGFKLIDLTSTSGTGVGLVSNTQFFVENDGFVKLPVIGRVKVSGMTAREAENFLEEKYSVFYNEPFVLLRATNKRVYVFPGSGGNGMVVPLLNENTTLIEALALAGGITEAGKARKIKLIRGDYSNPKVYNIDLSTVEGMTQSNLFLQANDIIYVEPVKRISQGIVAEITPILSLITSIILIITITTR